MASFDINSFRSQLEFDGARPNLFEVLMNFPAAVQPGNAGQKMRVMAKATQLPPSIIGVAPIMYQGREVKLAGNTTYPEWTVTVINDEDHIIKNAFERWKNKMNQARANVRSPEFITPAAYCVDWVVNHLGKRGDTIKSYNFIGGFPVDVSPVDVDWGANDTVEEFTVTFQYQLWEDLANNIV